MPLISPAGNWQWLWHIDDLCGGDPARIAAWLKAGGYTGVLVKTHDGEWDWMARNRVADLVAACHAAGVRCGGWYYSVGNWDGPVDGDPGGDVHHCTIAAELDLLDAAFKLGVNFAVIDNEKEWCLNGAAAADDYGRQLRARFPKGQFGVYSGAVPSVTGYWVGNPLDQLAGYVDGWLWQVYTAGWGIPEQVDAWTAKAVGLAHGLPSYPIYDVRDPNGAPVPASYPAQAVAAAKAHGCVGVSWWQAGVFTAGIQAAVQAAAAPLLTAEADQAAAIETAKHEAIQKAYSQIAAAGYRWLVGLQQREYIADLTGILPTLPTDARLLVCEKGVLWCGADGRVDAMHRQQFEAIEADGKARAL
ncbi:MAG TPA: hypothetical protein VFL91_00670 [Thermomicrobiales bacterium]|nr:hypothetical protein [Thermomicrobiales bacterium]